MMIMLDTMKMKLFGKIFSCLFIIGTKPVEKFVCPCIKILKETNLTFFVRKLRQLFPYELVK